MAEESAQRQTIMTMIKIKYNSSVFCLVQLEALRKTLLRLAGVSDFVRLHVIVLIRKPVQSWSYNIAIKPVKSHQIHCYHKTKTKLYNSF